MWPIVTEREAGLRWTRRCRQTSDADADGNSDDLQISFNNQHINVINQFAGNSGQIVDLFVFTNDGTYAGYSLGNIDTTIIAQAPRLAPHIAQMVANIAADCGARTDQVNVKATTTEHLGFAGRGEGIAALASVLLVRTAATD